MRAIFAFPLGELKEGDETNQGQEAKTHHYRNHHQGDLPASRRLALNVDRWRLLRVRTRLGLLRVDWRLCHRILHCSGVL